MSDTTNLNLRLDKELKKQAEELFAGLGINMTTAINIFLRQAVREQGIPFQITAKLNSKENSPQASHKEEISATEKTQEVHVINVIKPKDPLFDEYVSSKLKEADINAKIDHTRYTIDELTNIITGRYAR